MFGHDFIIFDLVDPSGWLFLRRKKTLSSPSRNHDARVYSSLELILKL
jgi:hypothetical protein